VTIDDAAPVGESVRHTDRVPPNWTMAAVLGMVTAWVIVVGRLVMMRHDKFGTFDYDLGIHDQAIWGLARGEWFNTVRGMASLGHHATFAYFLLAPLSWLGAGPNIWNVLQCLAIASCAVPIHLLVRRRTGVAWTGVAFAAAWLLQPWLSWFAQETFHPEVMAMPFLFWGYFLVDSNSDDGDRASWRRGDWWALGVFVIAMSWKEDVALAVMMLGVVVWLMGRRRVGAVLAGAGVVWFVIFGAWMVPHLAGGTATYGGIYGELGDSSVSVLVNSLRHPGVFLTRLGDNNAPLYVVRLLAPLGFLSVLAPLPLLVMAPQFFANILTTANFTYQPHFHYQAMPMVVLMISAIEGICRFATWRSGWRRVLMPVLIGSLVMSSLVAARTHGILPFGNEYAKGAWPLGSSNDADWRAAIARVGPRDGVASHYLGVPHLTHRKVVYTFPNPWLNSYYGTSPSDVGDQSEVKWIVVVVTAMDERATAELSSLLASGEFGDEQRFGDVATYRRLRPAQTSG
jgi:uncharacterized membrane protein